MAYIFLDESGDLGFSEKSSKWFLITVAIIPDSRVLEHAVKKIWRSLRKKHAHVGELHASNEKDVTRRRMLHMLAKIDCLQVMTVVLNKTKVYIDLQNQKNYLYNFTANILLDGLHSRDILADDELINLVVDRKDTKKSLRDNFVSYLTTSMKRRRKGTFKVELHASHENKSLQAVDFVSWAIFRKYKHNDFEFYEIIKDKIVDERLLFP